MPLADTRRWFCAVALVLVTRAAEAQFEPLAAPYSPGAQVSGFGQSRAKPDALQLFVHVQAVAELSDDALIKFREARQRTIDALDGLKLEQLKVIDHGVRLGNDGGGEDEQMFGNAPAVVKPQVSVSSKLELRLLGIREKSEHEVMELTGRLIDAAKDAGASVIPIGGMSYNRYGYPRQTGALVQFLLTDVRTLREQAYQKAVDDARRRAERLAGLLGVRLGAALSVQEMAQPQSGNNMQFVQYLGNAAMIPESDEEPDEAAVKSEHFTTVVIPVRLLVRYAMTEPQR